MEIGRGSAKQKCLESTIEGLIQVGLHRAGVPAMAEPS